MTLGAQLPSFPYKAGGGSQLVRFCHSYVTFTSELGSSYALTHRRFERSKLLTRQPIKTLGITDAMMHCINQIGFVFPATYHCQLQHGLGLGE